MSYGDVNKITKNIPVTGVRIQYIAILSVTYIKLHKIISDVL
jgi:hypothetical protein